MFWINSKFDKLNLFTKLFPLIPCYLLAVLETLFEASLIAVLEAFFT